MVPRREIRYLGLHQRSGGLCTRERLRIRRLLLCSGFLLSFEICWKFEEVKDILKVVHRGKRQNAGEPPPAAPGFRRNFCRRSFHEGLQGWAGDSPAIFANLNGDDFNNIFRGNVATKIGRGIPSCKNPNIG